MRAPAEVEGKKRKRSTRASNKKKRTPLGLLSLSAQKRRRGGKCSTCKKKTIGSSTMIMGRREEEGARAGVGKKEKSQRPPLLFAGEGKKEGNGRNAACDKEKKGWRRRVCAIRSTVRL